MNMSQFNQREGSCKLMIYVTLQTINCDKFKFFWFVTIPSLDCILVLWVFYYFSLALL